MFILISSSAISQSQSSSFVTCNADPTSPIPFLDLGNQFGSGRNTSRDLYDLQNNNFTGNFLYSPSTSPINYWTNGIVGPSVPNPSYNALNTGALASVGTSTLFNMVLNGTFYVDATIAIDYSLLLMGENAKIVVQSGCTLAINATAIRSCGVRSHLWDQIELQDNSWLFIGGFSEIEDANIAVHALNNSHFNIRSTYFNKNRIGIEVDGPNVDGTIEVSTYFECYTDANWHLTTSTPTNDVLNPPLSSQRSEAGVVMHNLNSFNSIAIGSSFTTIGGYNYFGNLDYGIKAYNSNFSVLKTRFVDINNTAQPKGANLVGTAIFIDGTPIGGSSNSSAIIGEVNTSTLFRNCTFENCKRGVYSTKPSNLQIKGNTFIDNSYICLDVRDNLNRNIKVAQNTFTNFWNGCRFRNCINSSSFNITANTFNGPSNLPAGLGRDLPYTGVILVNTPIGNTNANINENIFNDVRIGVYGNMIDNVSLGSNQIYFTRLYTDLQNKAHAGFWIEGSNRITAINNNVLYSNFASVPPSQLNSFKSLMRGFNLKALTNSTIRDNLVSACGTPVRMIDDCNFTYLNCNTFNACAQGLLFQNLIIPKQGSASSATGNYWTNFSAVRVLGNLRFPTDYYYINSTTENPSPASAPATCIRFFPTPTTQQSLCGFALQDPNLDISRIDDIINEANTFSNEEAIVREKERIDAFLMLIDSIALYPEYQYWIDSISNTSTGFYSKLIAENEDRNDIRNALSQINTFEDTRLMDKKNLYVLAISEQLGDTSVIYDSLALENLANTNAWDGTSAVFLARGILGIEVDDEELGLRLSNQAENKNCTINATLQGDFLSLLVESKYVIEMYDAMGRKIESLETQNSMNINTTTYKQKGVQVIRIYNSDCQKVIKLP